jgi:hypothetical protein
MIVIPFLLMFNQVVCKNKGRVPTQSTFAKTLVLFHDKAPAATANAKVDKVAIHVL